MIEHFLDDVWLSDVDDDTDGARGTKQSFASHGLHCCSNATISLANFELW
jgi:hypothetical protein